MTLVFVFPTNSGCNFSGLQPEGKEKGEKKKDFPFYQAKAKQTKWKFRNFPFGLHYSL